MLLSDSSDRYQQVLDLAREVALRSRIPHDVADDVAQDTVITYFVQDTAPDNWEAWTTTVAKNKVVDYIRSQKRIAQSPEDAPGMADPTAYRRSQFAVGPSGGIVAKFALSGVLRYLNDRDRELLEAQAAGMSNAEIAEQFDLKNENTVAVTIHRIKKRLRERFPDLAAEPDHPRLY